MSRPSASPADVGRQQVWRLRVQALARVLLDDARRLLRFGDWLVFLLPASLTVAALLNRSPNAAVGRWLVGLLIGSLWLSLVFVAGRRARDQRATAGSLQRLSRHLHSSHPFSDTLRADSAHAHSILEEVTTEVAQVLSQSERRWKARARLSADWYWETDEAMRVVWVSEDLQSHLKLGLRPEELLGRRHDEVPFYSAPDGGWEPLQQLQAQRKTFRDLEIEVQRPGRSPVWMALSGRPRLSPDNRFMGYEGIGRDVTERRLSFKRLYESERRYAVIADLSADWYWETDANHRIAFMGPLAHELLGEVANRASGVPRWIAYADGTSEEAWARHRDDLQARRPFRGFEFRIRRAVRGPLWVSISGLPRHNERGEFLGYHGVGRDITLRKRAEKILLTRNAQLERLVAERTGELEQTNRDLEAFSRQLAHELRTPIGHVVGLADLLRARAWERLSEEERGWLTLQGQSARAMSQTVTALLELARSNSLPMVCERVDLSALAHSVAAELPWLERRAPVKWLIQPGLASDCSAALMRVVLMNLMANAAKFTRDIEQPLVRIGGSGEVGERRFFVRDNGAGFDERRGATLFQPFVRLHAQEQFQGTGLGLSIVRRIVERHGGQVSARGEPGLGACFEFTLAAPDARAANGDPTLEDGEALGDRLPTRAPPRLDPTQVFIAGESPDDDHRSVA